MTDLIHFCSSLMGIKMPMWLGKSYYFNQLLNQLVMRTTWWLHSIRWMFATYRKTVANSELKLNMSTSLFLFDYWLWNIRTHTMHVWLCSYASKAYFLMLLRIICPLTFLHCFVIFCLIKVSLSYPSKSSIIEFEIVKLFGKCRNFNAIRNRYHYNHYFSTFSTIMYGCNFMWDFS